MPRPSPADILWQRLTEQHLGFAEDRKTKGLEYSNVMPAEADSIRHGLQLAEHLQRRHPAAQRPETELTI